MARPSYHGAKVKLVRDIRTQGGVMFRAGLVMRVVGVERAGLVLAVFVRGDQRVISSVGRDDVTVLEWAKKDEERDEHRDL